jgi:uncharacterized OB-fold protein
MSAPALTGYRTASGEVTIPLPGSTLETVPEGAEALAFAGDGRIVTYSVVHVPSTRFKDQAPYVLAVIELAEGARLLGLVHGAANGGLAVDGRVRFSHSDGYGHHFVLA